jgi:hypothetical protein
MDLQTVRLQHDIAFGRQVLMPAAWIYACHGKKNATLVHGAVIGRRGVRRNYSLTMPAGAVSMRKAAEIRARV